jgi:outer membrane protein assembly factor BamB
VDKKHLETACPDAPSLIALDKLTGRLIAKDDENFGRRIFHCGWSSPALGEVNGQKLLFFGGPDAIMYAFKALPEDLNTNEIQTFTKVWQFDCDPTAPKEDIHAYRHNINESPSGILGMPVFYKNRIYLTVGGDIWWGKREAWLKCIDATKKGDITRSGEIWSHPLENSSSATPAISDGLVYVTDCGRNLHCIDAENGRSYWTHELELTSWSSALVADSKVYVGSRGKDFWILEEGREKKVLHSVKLDSPIYSTPVAANGVLYISTMKRLYAIEQ